MRIRPLPRALLSLVVLSLTTATACGGGSGAASVKQLSWAQLQATYDYDASAPLDASVETLEQTEYFSTEKITFTAHDGAQIPAILYLPQTRSDDPVPCILLLHGYGGDKESYAAGLAPFVTPMGVAVMAIDARMHGQRPGADREMFSADLQRTHDAMVNTVIDNRRALDYLDTREQIDHDRYMCLGLSMGAILGSVLSPVEERVKSAALIVGGGHLDELVMESQLHDAQRIRQEGITRQMLAEHLADVEPTNFIGHFSPRSVLMLNGRQDEIVTPQCAAYLHEGAREPKEIVWYDGGHVPPPAVMFTYLGPFIQQQLIETGG